MACHRLSMVPFECVARGYRPAARAARVPGNRVGVRCATAARAGRGIEAAGTHLHPGHQGAARAADENVPFSDVAAAAGPEVAADLAGSPWRCTGAAPASPPSTAAFWSLTPRSNSASTRAACASLLADEVLTPDSSRLWPASQWQPGRPRVSFDKQIVRDWLDSPESGWAAHRDSEPPPALPDRVVGQTRAGYIEAYERITGRQWSMTAVTWPEMARRCSGAVA